MSDSADRYADLKKMLTERRQEMQEQLQRRIRDERSDRTEEVLDVLEHSDAEIRGDIEFALLQMRSETLARIDEALARLEIGKYGRCFTCEGEISERRLHALPFAVRCQACEHVREQEQGTARRVGQRHRAPLFNDFG